MRRLATLPVLLSAISAHARATVRLDAAGKTAPSEFRIFAFGPFQTTKGTFSFDHESARACMDAFKMQGVDCNIDYEHMALAEPPMPSPAAGWCSLEVREDGLWATNVKWSPKAKAHLEAGEYRYFSPALIDDPETGRVMKLVNIALTNLPATMGMQPLVAAKNTPGDPGQENAPMKTLLAALALQATATEAEAVTALSAREALAKKTQDDLAAKLSAKDAEIVALTGAKSADEAKGVLLSWKDSHAKVVELSAKLKDSQDKIAAMTAEQASKDAEALVEQGIKDGKIAPAQREFWLGQGKANIKVLSGYLATAPALVSTKPTEKPADPVEQHKTTVLLSAEEKKVAAKMGITEAAMLERKAASQKAV